MSNDSSLRAQVAVALLPRLNTFGYRALLDKCGGIEGFFLENKKALSALYAELNIREGIFDRETAIQSANREIAEMEKHSINICSYEHALFPHLLEHCEDAPLVFFYKGTLAIPTATTYLAIVGTRHASARCQQHVNSIIEELAGCRQPLVIVSGLAYGIDASAHRASLKYGVTTYAVLGHGLHMVYPASHKKLAENILANKGALISEFPCSATIHPTHFLQRNRIIAGLSHSTLIAESAAKGGAMTTARIALSYNRDVMAIPGRPEDSWSAGCNRLIKENAAALVENGTDIIRALNLIPRNPAPVQTSLDLFNDDKDSNHIIQVISEKNGSNIDELSLFSGIPVSRLSAILLQLELEGRISALPGKTYITN